MLQFIDSFYSLKTNIQILTTVKILNYHLLYTIRFSKYLDYLILSYLSI